MARMHTRKRGKSSSTRPVRTENPAWVPLSKDEVVESIIKLAKEGHTMSMIGMKLRDQYGVPSIKLATGKSLYQILREHDLTPEIPEDLGALMRRAIRIHNHLSKNRKDIHNKRNLQRVESKIRRLVKYYRRTGKLPPDWNYSIETAKLIVG